MTAQYPEVLADFADARQRFEADGIQYVARFEPDVLSAGQATNLRFTLQSVVDAPVNLSVALEIPKPPRKVQGFQVAQQQIQFQVQAGEVSELKIPLLVVDAPPGNYFFRLSLQGKVTQRAQRIRPPKASGRMPAIPIRDVVGLELANTVGIAYQSKPERRVTLGLKVQGTAEPAQADMTPTVVELWKGNELELQVQATKEFSVRRLHIIPPLTRQVVFTAMLNESCQRFSELGMSLSLGEAIFLTKMLTYTVELFLSDEVLQDGLFIPVFQRLLASQTPFDNATWLLMKFGYTHIVNLAIALSFGLLENHWQKRFWPIEEQRVLRNFVVGQLRRGQPLPIDLLYIPLILGGVLVGRQVTMPGEKPEESVAAIKKSRDDHLAELSQADERALQLLDELLVGPSGR